MKARPLEPLKEWPRFMKAVRLRMEKGRRVYGGRSFRRAPVELVGEVEEELMDVVGWSFILWHRVRTIKDTLEGRIK